jgi:hypothetical protein
MSWVMSTIVTRGSIERMTDFTTPTNSSVVP